MLAKSSRIRHPLGTTIETPLLVPSFSSKGFGFDRKGISEVSDVLKIAREFLTESMLVSAYDIYYEHLPKLEEFQAVPEIIFLDSGGYETSDEHDLPAVFTYPWPAEKWDESCLRSVLDMWPNDLPAVFVSFDHGSTRRPVGEQIELARELFAHYPGQCYDIIIKPETKKQRYVQIPSVLSHIEGLSSFHIIGFTEKELGNSVLKRMEQIAKVRMALDEARIDAPIHIFGSLDPVTSCLYFLAGAEIFDGLTWLRYSYRDGIAIYRQNYGILCVGIQEREDSVRSKAIVDNLYALKKLRFSMKDFLLDYDFNKFTHHGKVLKDYYDTLRSQLGGRI